MPVASEREDTPAAGLTEVAFKKSVPMVTYLAIFVVCDFVFIKGTSPKARIPIKVGANVFLSFFQDYF